MVCSAVRERQPSSARSRPPQFCRELLPDLRHLVPYRGVGSRVPRVDSVERRHEDGGGGQPAKPLVVGPHDVPRRPLRAGLAQHGLEGPLVVVPVTPLPDVTGGELPVLLRVVDPLEEPLGLLPLRQVQHDLDDMDPVVDQVALPVVDLTVAAGPHAMCVPPPAPPPRPPPPPPAPAPRAPPPPSAREQVDAPPPPPEPPPA